MKKILLILAFLLIGCTLTPNDIVVGQPLNSFRRDSSFIYVGYWNAGHTVFISDTLRGCVKYRYGGGWKDALMIVTTRNDTVLYVWEQYPKY